MTSKPIAPSSRQRMFSIVALMLQNCTLVLIMRWLRMQPGRGYVPSTAVFVAECLKLCASTLIWLYTHPETAGTRAKDLKETAAGPESDFVKMAIPAASYAVQNWWQYFAISRLDAPTFQVTAQLKILATSVCFVIVLKRSLTPMQWGALTLLTAGVILCQLPTKLVSPVVPIPAAAIAIGLDLLPPMSFLGFGPRAVGFLSMVTASAPLPC
ncbi:hypothetical protein HKX48_000016 [Thoreauomyces humboldtii]|nr:hypothetical protein HKX48_000016 [Thoreauomyces humboldtii]